jgi:hypothetical protein
MPRRQSIRGSMPENRMAWNSFIQSRTRRVLSQNRLLIRPTLGPAIDKDRRFVLTFLSGRAAPGQANLLSAIPKQLAVARSH